MMHGTIHRIRTEHGFGFIRDTEGAEVFFRFCRKFCSGGDEGAAVPVCVGD
jgi:cold shock CspA family protein